MKLFTLKEVQSEIEKILDIKVTYITMWLWVRKGYITSSMSVKNGNKRSPVYTMHDIEAFIEQYPILREKELIRKNYKRWEKK